MPRKSFATKKRDIVTKKRKRVRLSSTYSFMMLAPHIAHILF